jgi:F0F1-type ATP synthase assembly protein I
MSARHNPDSVEQTPVGAQKAMKYTKQAALAMELPFTMVGTVVVGGFIGYLLDKWLHISPWLMVVFGAVGFIGGVREVIRRVHLGESGNGSKSS